jgi:hypothetical protein
MDAVVRDIFDSDWLDNNHLSLAAIIFAHLATKRKDISLKEVNEAMSKQWRVRKGLHKQKMILRYLENKKTQ